MTLNSISILFIVVMALTLSLVSTRVLADFELDGKAFEVMLFEEGKDNATKDELIFKEGTFFSVYCGQYGFDLAPYIASLRGDTILFKSTAISDKEGKTEWIGGVKGDEIVGTMKWSKQGQEPINYNFAGKIKEAENIKNE